MKETVVRNWFVSANVDFRFNFLSISTPRKLVGNNLIFNILLVFELYRFMMKYIQKTSFEH